MIIYLASYLYAPVVIVNAIVYMLLCKITCFILGRPTFALRIVATLPYISYSFVQ